MPIYDFECKCGNKFEYLARNTDVKSAKCPECGKKAKKIFPQGPSRFDLKYDPKKDICDWEGNTTQYYRLYNEAKERGENVNLPEN